MNLKDALLGAGASAAAYVAAGEISPEVAAEYRQWLAQGCHAGMEYMERHEALRRNPQSVLEGVRSIIVLAFNYYPSQKRSERLPEIAYYAYGEDYHNVLRRRLKPVVKQLEQEHGARCRICIDSAPLAERYWAVSSGLGFLGRNGAVIVPGVGSFVFLVEVLTTLGVEELEKLWGEPCCEAYSGERKPIGCKDCGACVKLCPTGALRGDATVDARRCLSYLTIEHRGEFSAAQRELLAGLERVPLYGCDLCLRVCPHNRHCLPTQIAEFALSEPLQSLDASSATFSSSQEQFAAIFAKSPIKRLSLAGLQRNAKEAK